MRDIYKRPYRVRRAGKAAQYGKEITLAPETSFRPGQEVVQLFAEADCCAGDELVQLPSFVLIVPKGTAVDESLLWQAIELPHT